MFNNVYIYILKEAGILWNSTLVVFLDKLSTTTVVFFRSEGKLESQVLIWDLEA